ncbi:MAG: PadR family transcriptional regulator [Oscillospiraceae bacterium]|nr:PadR family transcriptional regulator [Oscillospiraceae bacterium]
MESKTDRVNFQRGVASLVLLGLLRQSDMYGYQLVQEMERQSLGALSMQEGALYPVLYKLEDGGYISSRKVLVGKRMTRVYYHLEPKGLAYLEQLREDYQTVVQGVFQIVEGKKRGTHDKSKWA